jgi:hypothetical protein
MSILSGIGQEPAIFGTGGGGGGVLVYSNMTGITTNLSNPTTNVSAFTPQSLGTGVYLVSFQIIINNLDSAPVSFSDYQINIVQSASVVAIQRQQLTLQPTQEYSSIFTAVVYNQSSLLPPTSNNIFLTVSSGAFATTAPTIITDNVTIVKIV